jgi:hypothetical protein
MAWTSSSRVEWLG